MYHAKMHRCHQGIWFRIVLAASHVQSHNLGMPLRSVVRFTCESISRVSFLMYFPYSQFKIYLYLMSYLLTNCQQYCTCYFFQWIDGPEVYDDYLLSPYVGILLGPSPAETWKRLVRPPPPKLGLCGKNNTVLVIPTRS